MPPHWGEGFCNALLAGLWWVSDIIAELFYKGPDAPRPNQPIGVGVLALVERGVRLLLERRSDCGRWGFVFLE